MTDIFKVGECFETFRELEEKINRFVKTSWTPLYKRDSRKIESYGRTKAPGKIVNESLVYGEMKYCCIHGGRSEDAKTRKSTNQMECPFTICIRADRDGKYLRITKAILEHNHPVSKEMYEQLPSRCRVRFESNSISVPQKRRKRRKKHSRTIEPEETTIHTDEAEHAFGSFPIALPCEESVIMEAVDDTTRLHAEGSSTEGNESSSAENEKLASIACAPNNNLHEVKMTLQSYYQRQIQEQAPGDANKALLAYLQRQNELDEEDKFFLSMSAMCKKLPEDVRAAVKLRIHQMIFDAEHVGKLVVGVEVGTVDAD